MIAVLPGYWPSSKPAVLVTIFLQFCDMEARRPRLIARDARARRDAISPGRLQSACRKLGRILDWPAAMAAVRAPAPQGREAQQPPVAAFAAARGSICGRRPPPCRNPPDRPSSGHARHRSATAATAARTPRHINRPRTATALDAVSAGRALPVAVHLSAQLLAQGKRC